jgi:hypothetical protein
MSPGESGNHGDKMGEESTKSDWGRIKAMAKKIPLISLVIYGAFLTAVLMGCGKGVGNYQVSSDFEDYVTSFTADAQTHGRAVEIHDLDIGFGDTGGVAGKCVQDFLQTPQIVVNQALWENLSDTSRTILIYHELGHCILERVHNPAMLNDPQLGSYPASIMNPVMIDDHFYQDKKQQYLDELFE